MRRAVIMAVTAAAVTVLGASAGSAFADGQQVCISGPGSPIFTPRAKGQCNQNFTLTTLPSQSDVASLQTKVADLESQVNELQGTNASLRDRVSSLENTLSAVSFDPNGANSNGQPTLTIEGANLQILNGLGQTASTNGTGNLFLGYDENHGQQTGSHDIVLGIEHVFSSYGGLVGGRRNELDGPFATVFGFANNVEPGGENASITGGNANTVLAENASVSGGAVNRASGKDSSVSGGTGNTASAFGASILGGFDNQVSTTCGTFPPPPTDQAC